MLNLVCSKSVYRCQKQPVSTPNLGIIKGKERSDHNVIGGTNMEIASMVFSSSEHVYPQSIFITTLEIPTSGPIREKLIL